MAESRKTKALVVCHEQEGDAQGLMQEVTRQWAQYFYLWKSLNLRA